MGAVTTTGADAVGCRRNTDFFSLTTMGAATGTSCFSGDLSIRTLNAMLPDLLRKLAWYRCFDNDINISACSSADASSAMVKRVSGPGDRKIENVMLAIASLEDSECCQSTSIVGVRTNSTGD